MTEAKISGKGKVVSLEQRRLARVPHVKFAADVEEGLVVQTISHPELGQVHVGYPLADVVRMIQALLQEGTKLGVAQWARWAAHIGEITPGDRGRALADEYARRWRRARPDVTMAPAAAYGVVQTRAAELAKDLLGEPLTLEAELWERAVRSHLTWNGTPFLAEGPCAAGCRWSLPWDQL